jgi:hypothetical protein
MGIAYSPDQTKLILSDVDASTPAALLAGLHTAVTAAGWSTVRSITDGHVYELTSPQDSTLKCRVRIQDTGRTLSGSLITGTLDAIDLQFLSVDEASEGYPHYLACEAGRVLRVHLNPCQVFIWDPAADPLSRGRSVSGGIPYVDATTVEPIPACAPGGPARAAEVWWNCGDTNDTGAAHTFRTHYRIYPGHWSAFYNGRLINSDSPATGYEGRGAVRILPLTPANPILLDERTNKSLDGTPEAATRWYGSERALYIEPLLAWWHEMPQRYIGQVWDSFLATANVTETEIVDGSETWVNYSKQVTGQNYSYYSSLFLLTVAGAAPAGVNVAY